MINPDGPTQKKYCDNCKPYIQNKNLFEKLNITETNLQLANKKAVKILVKEYFTNKKSMLMILDEYGIRLNTLTFFFKKNGIDLRSLSKGIKLGFKEKRSVPPTNHNYKCGYHTTWDGKKYWYRSSYEELLMNKLDELKELYLYESIVIPYTYDGEEYTYIPDFYLPERNLIIEVKGEYFQKKDSKVIEAKKEATIKEGYFYVMFGKKEIKNFGTQYWLSE